MSSGDLVGLVADLDLDTQGAAEGIGVPAQSVDLGEVHRSSLYLRDSLLTDLQDGCHVVWVIASISRSSRRR